MIELLEAAIDSPGCGHRVTSLTLLWTRVLQVPPEGREAARPGHLNRFVSSIRDATPVLKEIEDSWGLDPRSLVRFPFKSNRFEVHPGNLSNPLMTLRSLESLAFAVDSPLVANNGWGLGDLIEATLRYINLRISTIRSSWPSTVLPRDNDPEVEELSERLRRIAAAVCVLHSEERDAVAALPLSSRPWIEDCEFPDRAALAWEWATHDVGTIKSSLEADRSSLEGAMVVRASWIERPVPAALAISNLAEAAARLAAGLTDTPCDLVLRHLVAAQAFATLGFPLDGPDEAESHDQWWMEQILTLPILFAVPARRHAFIVGCAAGLDVETLGRSLANTEEALNEIGFEEIQGRGADFDATGSIHRVVVYGGPVLRPPRDCPGTFFLHVDELTDMVREAQLLDRTRVPSGELIWQFFEEASTLPGVDHLLALSDDDLWRHWLAYGVVGDGDPNHGDVFTPSVPDDRHWQRAADWEPFDEILAAASLPPSWTWPWARLGDEPDEATVTRLHEQYTIVRDPPLVVIGVLDDDLSELGIDATFGIGVADGIRLTISRDAEIADRLRCPDGGPLTIWVRLTAAHLPEREVDDGDIGLMTAVEPRPTIGLVCTWDWIDDLARNPAAAHASLAARLMEGVMELWELPSESVETFLRAWNLTPPVGLLRPYSASLLPRHLGKDNLLPRTFATRGRAHRRLRIATFSLPLGRYEGREAVKLCRDELLPAMQAVLDALLSEWSPEAMRPVAGAVNDAHAERFRLQTELDGALAAPWADRWRMFALDSDAGLHLTKPADLLLESLIASELRGEVLPDQWELAEAMDVIDEIYELAAATAGTKARLHGLVVDVSEATGVEILTGPLERSTSHVAINVPAYRAAERIHALRPRQEDNSDRDPNAEWLKHVAQHRREPSPHASIADGGAPGSLLRADQILQEEVGTGIDAISAVLATAVSWNSSDDKPHDVARSELLSQAASWSSLPESQISVAIDRLTLKQGCLAEERAQLWDDHRQRKRFSSRPFVSTDVDVLQILPWRVRVTQEFYAGSLVDGWLPWPSDEIPRRLREALLEYRQHPSKELEAFAASIARDLGLPSRPNIEPHHALAIGLTLPGEIDLLIADQARKRIWLCEVKDPTVGLSQEAMVNRLSRFVKAGGYVDKLLGKLQALREAPHLALGLLDLQTSETQWTVLPVMVTRAIEAAGFVEDARVPYVTVADLGDLLIADENPESGYYGFAL